MEVQDNKKHVFVDLDNTLVNIQKGILGIPQIQDIAKRNFITSYPQIEFYLGQKMWDIVNDQSQEFWENLSWIEESKKIWTFLINLKMSRNVEISILSAPLKFSIQSKIGKILWVEKNCGKDIPVSICEYTKKYIFSGPGHYLIDDWDIVKFKWEVSGGVFIHHKTASETLSTLKTLLK